MILIKDLKDTGTIESPGGDILTLPQEFLDTLPETCSCGGDLLISETLTQVCCSNHRCVNKIANRAADMLASLGVKGMGLSKCKDFFTCLPLYTPYALFLFNPDRDYDNPKYPFSSYFSKDFLKGIYNQIQEHNSFTLAEFVKKGFFPGIQDSAFVLFKDYDNLTDFYNDLDTQGNQLVADLMKLDVNSKSVIETCSTLRYFKNDLLAGEKWVNIRKAVTTINICISTAVGPPYANKAAYVAYMNEKYASKVHLNFLNSVTKNCQYLILADKSATTNKAQKARQANIPIMTGAEFEAYIKTL